MPEAVRPAARLRPLVGALACWALAGCSFVIRAEELVQTGTMRHAPLAEVSGIVRSRTYDVYWVHNDSGDSARIFAVHADGSVVLPPYVASHFAPVRADGDGTDSGTSDKPVWPGIGIANADNIDWEDIDLDAGTLYVADTGNNGNARRDLGVYVIPEPNPAATERVRALRFLPIRYPEQAAYPGDVWHYDCEALFIDHGKLYFLTKHRRPGAINGFEAGTQLYRLDTDYGDRVNTLTHVESSADPFLPTAAALSPDGTHLAVLTYLKLWVFDRPADGSDHWLSAPARTFDLPALRTGIVEGVTWDDATTLVLASENRGLFRLPLAELRAR